MKLPSGMELLRICLKIFGVSCWALWGTFTLAFTGMAMWKTLTGDAPFFQGAIHAGICGVGIGFVLSHFSKRFMMKYEFNKAAKEVLKDFKNALTHTAKIREKIKTEFDLMVENLMEGDTDQAVVHQKNMQRLQDNYEAVLSEHISIFDKVEEKKDDTQTSS
jgi:hypothetical protein